MVMVTDKNFAMDGFLKDNLDRAKQAVKDDWDMVFVVDGHEGSGKSVLAQQMAYYLDPSLNVERIAFSPSEFQKAIDTAQKYQAVVYDEAHEGISSRQALSQINRKIVSMLMEIRQKNLFVFIVLPTIFELDSYVAVFRSRALIHVYAKDFKRGTFTFFNQESKKRIYFYGKKNYYSYSGAKANFFGTFPNAYTVDKEAYLKKKREALKRYGEQGDRKLSPLYQKWQRQRNTLVRFIYDTYGLKHREIADMMSCTRSEVSKILRSE